MNLTGKINLMRLRNACIVTVKGRTATKRGVFIPIDDNSLFVSADENLNAKAVYVDVNVWENRAPGKYGNTHSIRQSLPKEVRENMTDEALKEIPFIGNLRPFESVNAAQTVTPVATAEAAANDDLPF